MNVENVDTFVTMPGTDVKSGGGKKRPAKEGRGGRRDRREAAAKASLPIALLCKHPCFPMVPILLLFEMHAVLFIYPFVLLNTPLELSVILPPCNFFE